MMQSILVVAISSEKSRDMPGVIWFLLLNGLLLPLLTWYPNKNVLDHKCLFIVYYSNYIRVRSFRQYRNGTVFVAVAEFAVKGIWVTIKMMQIASA